MFGGFGPEERVLAVVPALMNWRILALKSVTDVKTPRRMACRSVIPNQNSTSLSGHEPGPDRGNFAADGMSYTWSLHSVVAQP